MSKRYRLNLEGLEQPFRPSVLASIVEAAAGALMAKFSDEDGFERNIEWEYPRWLNSKKHSPEVHQVCQVAVLTAWKGDYRGVQLKIIPRDPVLKQIEVRIRGFAPQVESRIDSIEKQFAKYQSPMRWLHGLLWPLYLLYGALVLPLILARIALTWRWRADISAAISVMDCVWATLQSRWQGFPAPKRAFHPALAYLLALLVASTAMVACFLIVAWWTEDPVWEAILIVTGGLLGIACIGCIAAVVLTLLGFESDV